MWVVLGVMGPSTFAFAPETIRAIWKPASPELATKRAMVVCMNAYADIIFQLNSPRRVKLDLLQGLPHDIVRLPLALLGGFNRRSLVNVAFIVHI